MLASRHRITGADQYRQATRGRRAAGSYLVVHSTSPDLSGVPGVSGARIGFVVSKAVGVAVVRNLVKRRLRHLVRERFNTLPAGSMLVVRALPAAAGASYAELGADLDKALLKLSGSKAGGTK